MNPPKITASIVVHRAPAEQLRRVLGCVTSDRVDKVRVIDNGPDNSLAEVVRGFDRCDYLHVVNRGFGAGHNMAIREAAEEGSDFHVVLNADVVWDGDVIGRMADYAVAHPDVLLMGPKVFYPDGALQYSCRMLPTPSDLILKRFIPASLTRESMRRYLLADVDHDRPFECSYLLGSFMFFRTRALVEEGMFDERFFMYPEDIDISRRLAMKGRVLYWPEASIVHEHAAASRRSLRMLGIHVVNMCRYFNKWGWIRDEYRRESNKRLVDLPRVADAPEGRG